MSQKTIIEQHRKRIKEVMEKTFIRPGIRDTISIDGIDKDNTLIIDCHGGTLEDVFFIPNNLKIVTYTRKNSELGSDEVLEFYTKITMLNNLGLPKLILPKKLNSECHIYNKNPDDCDLFNNANCSFSFEYTKGIFQKLGFFMYDDLIKEEIYNIYNKGEKILEIKGIDYADLLKVSIYKDEVLEKKLIDKLGEEGKEVVRDLSHHNSSDEKLLEYIGQKVELTYEEKKKHLWLHSDKLKRIINGYQNTISRAAKSAFRRIGIKPESKYDKLVRFILEENEGQIKLNDLIKRIDIATDEQIKNYVLLFCRSPNIQGPVSRTSTGEENNTGTLKTVVSLKAPTYGLEEQCSNRDFKTYKIETLKRIKEVYIPPEDNETELIASTAGLKKKKTRKHKKKRKHKRTKKKSKKKKK